jgi:hypothetical protein
MADEDDDFLDLCEDSSPLPDHNIGCGDTKSFDASVKCTTVLSSDYIIYMQAGQVLQLQY